MKAGTDLTPAEGFLARGGAWVAIQSVLMAGVLVLGVCFPGNESPTPLIIAGAGLFALGAYLGIAGVVVLGRNRTPYPQPREGSVLVQRGIYARVRHPLYASVIAASIGWALLCRSIPAFIVALILIPFFQAKARREERWLRERFPDYADYERRVPRFLPRLRRPPQGR